MEIFFKWSLTYRSIGGVNILRPSSQTRAEVRKNAEAHLRKKYSPGTYTDNETCNEILQYLFKFYEIELEKSIELIATSRWVGELLFQYDESAKVSKAYKRNELSLSDHQLWRQIGAIYRQSLDLLCEKLAIHGNISRSLELWELQIPDLEKALVYAENCVEYAEVSNYTHMIVPNATSITIYPLNSDRYFEHNIKEELDLLIRNYHQQNHKEITKRAQYLDNSFDPFDFQFHASVINDKLKETMGVTYSQYQRIVTIAPASFPPAQSFKSMPMCRKDHLLAAISEEMELSTAHTSQIFNSLVLDTSTPRNVWNSRQSNRINKQPFLQFSSDGKEFIMWSNRKVEDFLSLLDSELTFNKPPKGWSHPDLVSAVTEISNEAGRWFERSASNQLRILGFKGCQIKPTTFDDYPGIKFTCGEIDFLAYHEGTNCLAIFEFKMFETGFDARGVRQVRSSFMEGEDAYTKVFEKKIEWVEKNISFVKQFLMEKYKLTIPSDVTIVYQAFLTYYPSLMSLFFSYPTCKSLVEFVDAFEAKGNWPYKATKKIL